MPHAASAAAVRLTRSSWENRLILPCSRSSSRAGVIASRFAAADRGSSHAFTRSVRAESRSDRAFRGRFGIRVYVEHGINTFMPSSGLCRAEGAKPWQGAPVVVVHSA